MKKLILGLSFVLAFYFTVGAGALASAEKSLTLIAEKQEQTLNQ